MTPELYWIPGLPTGKLAIAARPRGGDWLEDEIDGWRRASVDVVVSLLEADEEAQLDLAQERQIAEAEGIRFISFPIRDRGVPSQADAFRVLKAIVKLLEQGNTIAVHCRQGIGRSGLIAVGAMIMSGIEADKALDAVSAARGLRVPETADQLEWIRGLAANYLVAG